LIWFLFQGCHYAFGHQFWFYNLVSASDRFILNRLFGFLQTTHQIINPPNDCLTSVLSKKTLLMKQCDASNRNQQWLWGFRNISALENWKTFGVKLP
jgi:hypothetical protein